MDGPFVTTETAWCPGCGNFAILETLAGVLDEMGFAPRDVLLVGGIGQAAKLNQYVAANGFSGLHGRALCAAVGAKMANDALTVVVNTGDGDSYGEGGNHFIHNIRRNVNIAHMVHDNQVYGLTKGQPSPTSAPCAPDGKGLCTAEPLNPLLLALAAGAGFVARAFTGEKEHMAAMMKAAIAFQGYALLDILQPCVSFNKVNTYAWYAERVYTLEADYKPDNLLQAMERSREFGERIPLGILYNVPRPTWRERQDTLLAGTAPPPAGDARAEQLAKLLAGYA